MIEKFYAILDMDSVEEPISALTQCYEGGCQLVQLRAKNWNKKDVLDLAKKIMEFKKNNPFTFIVNDHPDVAFDVGADGVHVGDNDIAPNEIRKKYGDKFLIGYSTHSLEEIKKSLALNVDYIAFGAIYKSPSKNHEHPMQGLEKLKKAVEICGQKTLVAIGGINRKNIDDVLKTGVNSVAMINAWIKAEDIKGEVNWWVNHLNKK